MRKNLLAFLIVIIVLVLNVVLVSVLVQETDRTGDGAHHFPSLEVAVKLIPNSSASDLSNLLSVTSSSFSDSLFSPSPEKLAIAMVKENVRSSTRL